MANPDHLDKLCQGPKVWNDWRRENPHIVPDLSQATLGLNQRQFGPSNGGPIDLRAATLDQAMLRFATLTEANFEGARLIGADLMHARLDRAKLVGADLTDALLDHADLTGADLSRAIITGASFINVRNLTQLQIEEAFGDASTLLPASLVPPESWFPALDDEDGYGDDDSEEEEIDLYEVLGVQHTATAEEIRVSYRALVKKLHPDVNPDDKAAQEQFKLVSNAYRILGDPEKRAAYHKGEIDSDGRVRPEYEAEQRFRKYAYRFYAAAALSVIVALGALAFAWHAVLHSNERSTVAVTAPKQNIERLANDQSPNGVAKLEIGEEKAEAVAELAGFGKQDTPSELEKKIVVPSAQELENTPRTETTTPPPGETEAKSVKPAAAVPPAPVVAVHKPTESASATPANMKEQSKAVESADAAPAIPSAAPAPSAQTVPVEPAKTAPAVAVAPTSPQSVSEVDNSGASSTGNAKVARQTEAVEPAASSTPKINQPPHQQQLALHTGEPASPLAEDHKGEEAGATQSHPASLPTPEAEMEAHRTQPNYAAISDPGAGVVRADGQAAPPVVPSAAAPDTVSKELRKRAVNKALAKQDPASTGSIDDSRTVRPDGSVSTHSLPASRAVKAHRRKHYVRRAARRLPRIFDDSPYYVDELVSRKRMPRDWREERRREAVSDILMGGQ